MDQKSFELLYTDAENALLQNHLLDALNCIQGILFDLNRIELKNELESIQQDYGMMLQFMQQGGNDPQRNSIHQTLIHRSFTLLDNASRIHRMQSNKGVYAEAYQKSHEQQQNQLDTLTMQIRLLQDKLTEDSLQPDFREKAPLVAETESKLYALYDRLFNWIWTEKPGNAHEAEALKACIDSQHVSEQALLVSALTLNLWTYFDPNKYRILLAYCHSDTAEVRARALTAIVWTYMKHEKRFPFYPDLLHGLSLLNQDARILREMNLLQRQMLLSLETAKAEKKLQNEIFPDILKSKNYQRNKMGFEEVEEELAKALRGEPNAEWEHMKENKQLANNMKEIIEMSKEGIDINLGTFSSLKSFSFFHQTSNWFAPFNINRPEIKSIFSGSNNASHPLQTLMETGSFCDSDKYSLSLMLNQFTSSQSDLIMSQFEEQIDHNEEALRKAVHESQNIEYIYRNYLQNLYRFFKLYTFRHQFNDPFKMDLLFSRYSALEELLHTPAYLMDMASFLIRREYYQDAILYIEKVLKTETATTEMLQKMAFCYQHLGNPHQAIYYYQQADLLNPDNEWILQQMHLCYSALGKHEQELRCLQSLEAINPQNARLISEIGLCLMQLKRYEEAANHFYKLEYMGERVTASWRAIAWCNFKMNKLEQAEKYYQKLLQHEKVNWEDYLNAGHTSWCKGDFAQAVSHYRSFLKKYSQKIQGLQSTNLLQPFDEDTEELLLHGIPSLDICLMRDIIRPEPQ